MKTERTVFLFSTLALLAFSLDPAPVLAQSKGAKPSAPAAKGTAKLSASAGAIFDNRVPQGEMGARFVIELNLQGEDVPAVKSLRANVTKATDDTGRDLVATRSQFLAGGGEWEDVRGERAPSTALTLGNPTRKAKTASVEGTIETYIPSHDPNATVKIDQILSKRDKPLSVPSLASLKVKLGVLSKAGLEKEKAAAKAAEEKKKADEAKKKKKGDGVEEMGEAIGGAFAQIFEQLGYAVGENDIVLKVEDPGKKIFTFGLSGPDGKAIPTYGTHTVGDYRVLRVGEKVPEGAALEVRLKTDKSFAEIPFKLVDIKLP